MNYLVANRAYQLPLRTSLRTAHGLWAEREGLLVRLEDEAGRVGYGEVAPIPWFGTETLAEARDFLASLGGRADGEALDAAPAWLGCVRFALNAARAQPEPAGPSRRLAVAALLPAGRAVLEALRQRLQAGYMAFKWKVGAGRLEDELALLDEVLAGLPAYARLRLDANGGWSRTAAARWLGRCAERPVEFVEQPLAPEDEDGLLGLAADYPVKIALDESVTGFPAARAWQQRGWKGVFVLKPALAGPLTELAAWVKSTGADIVLSSAIETALGRAAIIRLAAGQELTHRPLGFGVDGVFGDPRWDGPPIGPLVDATWAAGVDPGELWQTLA